MPSYAPLKVDLIANLKALPVGSDPTIVLVVGAVATTDGLGGFYRWDSVSTVAEETKFYNTVMSSTTSSGRWVRVFQRIRIMPGGYMVLNGGFKSYFVTGTLNASGQLVAYLTDTGTATGNALFTEVWTTQGDSNSAGTTANDSVIGTKKSLTADLKTLTYQFVRGSSTTLTGILGLVIPGLQAAASGTTVTLQVSGI